MMTPGEYRELREQLGLDHNDLAAVLGVTAHCSRRYEAGKRTIGQPIANQLRFLVGGRVKPKTYQAVIARVAATGRPGAVAPSTF